MSWNDYIQLIQQDGEDCDSGCIIGRDGSIWTTHQENVLTVTAEEALKIANGLSEPIDFTNGVVINGQKYTFIRKDEKFLFFRKSTFGSICIQWSDQLIIIAHCKEGGSTGKVTEALHKTVCHLESSNY